MKKPEFVMVLLLLLGSCGSRENKLLWQFPQGRQLQELTEQKKFPEALKIAAAFVQKFPQNELMIFNLATLLEKNNKTVEAVSEYKKILSTSDKVLLEKTLFNLGNLEFLQNNLEIAIEYFREALLVNPENYNIKYNLELALLKKKQEENDPKKKQQEQKSEKDQQEKKQENGNKDQEDASEKKNTPQNSTKPK